MIRIETGGITSFVEALQAPMSETVDHTLPLSPVNVRCQLTLVNLYVNGQTIETCQCIGSYTSPPFRLPLVICLSITHTQRWFEVKALEGRRDGLENPARLCHGIG